MRKLFSAVLAVLALVPFTLTPFVLSGCDDGKVVDPGLTASQPTSETLSYVLVEPRDLNSLGVELDTNGISVQELRIEEEGFTAGFTVGGRPIADISQEFLRQHRQFLETMASGELHSNQSSTEASWAEKLVTSNNPRITSFTCAGMPSAVEQQLNARILTDDELALSRQEVDPPSAPDSYTHEHWAPCSGWSRITQQMTYQEFRFNHTEDFYSGSTYEHETQIYNRNFADYAGYWSTNMPSGYMDTRIFDNPAIENYAIGTYRADYLSPWTTYWTYIALRPGSQNNGECRIKGQWGYRWPAWCYSPYCVQNAYTSGSLAYLALPNYGIAWTY